MLNNSMRKNKPIKIVKSSLWMLREKEIQYNPKIIRNRSSDRRILPCSERKSTPESGMAAAVQKSRNKIFWLSDN